MLKLIVIRGDIGEGVKPEAMPVNGQKFNFVYGFQIDDEDRRYPGESAWIPDDQNYPTTAPAWLASGDLRDVN